MNQTKNKFVNAWPVILPALAFYVIDRFLLTRTLDGLLLGIALGAFMLASPAHPKLPDAGHKAYLALMDLLNLRRGQEEFKAQDSEGRKVVENGRTAVREYYELLKLSW